jgi:kelch-like protein 17 (actinfilin)
VDNEPLVRENPDCKELLLEAMRYHLLPEQRSALSSYRTTCRQPDGIQPYLFAIGGGSLFTIHSECEVYNPRTDLWSSIAAMSTRRSRTAVATVGNMLYAVGGYDGSSDLASAECYNTQFNQVTIINTVTFLARFAQFNSNWRLLKYLRHLTLSITD